MNIFSQRHQEFLKSLLRHEVKFILIGGHAAIYYGVNRNTGDLDILIEPTAANGLRLFPSAFANALEINLSDITLKVINIQDLIRNKETLKREGEKSLMDRYDAEVLKKIIKRQKED